MTDSAALRLLASLVVDDDGHRWGEIAEPIQWEDATAILDPGSGDPRYHFLTRSRGRSKTSDLAGILLAAMTTQLGSGSRSYGAAVDQDQAALLVDSFRQFTMRTPELSGSFDVQSTRVVCLRTGAELDMLAADGPGAYGLRPAFLVVDEIAQWPTTRGAKQLFEALRTAAPKVPGCRMVLLTSAGHPAHWSAKELRHAQRSRLWRVHEVPGPAPWMSPDALEEQRDALPDSAYRRLFLNQWTEGDDGVRREDVEACLRDRGNLPPNPHAQHVVTADLSVTTDYTVVAVAHLEQTDMQPVVVIDDVRTWKPSRKAPVPMAEVQRHMLDVARLYHAKVWADPYQAAGLLQALRAQGVQAGEEPMTVAGNNRRSTLLVRLIRDHRLNLPNDDPELVDELSSLVLRESSPGNYKLDSDLSGLGHHDRATAISIAAAHLLEDTGMTAHDWGVAFQRMYGPEAEARRRELYGENYLRRSNLQRYVLERMR